jgi:hypothetical protein
MSEAMIKAIRRGNVVYDLESFQSGHRHIPPFLSSGLLGGCFDSLGFMSLPDLGTPGGRTVLGYLDHYARTESKRQVQYPLALLQARFADGTPLNLVDCTTYHQELDLLTGTLTTEYDLYGSTQITAFASQSAPNLVVMRVEREPDSPERELLVSVECETSACQNRTNSWPVDPTRVEFEVLPGRTRVAATTNCVTTRWTLACDSGEMHVEGTRIVIRLGAGRHELRLLVEREGCEGEGLLEQTCDKLYADHVAVWRDFWEESWVDLPEDRAQFIWTRSNYYLACNFPTTPARPMCPTGPMSNIWGFFFPQDVYYVAENLPRLGHFHRARTALQYWLDHLEDAQAYCKRIIGVEGAYYPWTPPYTAWDDYEADGVICPDSYELHNSAYVVAMVWHYYLTSSDREMLDEFFPLLEEVFRFYRNISSQNDSGAYEVYHEHARGQDEASSTAGRLKNLLCCQFSAEYTARAYVQAAEILGRGRPGLLAVARNIVASGYDKSDLLRPEGFYRTYEGDDRPIGAQKHPVQLNPIAFLPMPDQVEEGSPTEVAWRRRYDLMRSARWPQTQGWTFGEYTLASARMRSPKELERDLRLVQPAWSADPRWIQFYEYSWPHGWHRHKAYYFTTSGLYLQAVSDALVQDWRGYVDLFACLLPGWDEREFSFHGFHARGRVAVSGRWQAGRFEVTLLPHGESSVRVRVSRHAARITATGQADGPSSFDGERVVQLFFDGSKPIVLRGE